MAMDKAIQSGKEHRKPYRKAKAVDRSCRNGGNCPYCHNGRLHNAWRREYDAIEKEKDYGTCS